MMPGGYHRDVRTTLTLDDDVAVKLWAMARRSSRSFKDLVNHHLRIRLNARSERKPVQPFVVKARDLGSRDFNYDNITDLIEQTERPYHRWGEVFVS